MLLEKYTSCKTNNVFDRFGSARRPRSPYEPGGHERRRKNSYDQQPYYPMKSAYWGCTTPMYTQFRPRGFYPWAEYSTGPTDYFQREWIPSGRTYRRLMHEKRSRFSPEARSHNAVTDRGNLLAANNGDGIVHIGGQNFKWMPVNRESYKEAHDATTVGGN